MSLNGSDVNIEIESCGTSARYGRPLCLKPIESELEPGSDALGERDLE